MVNTRKPDSTPINPYKWDEGKCDKIRQMIASGIDLHDVAKSLGEPYDKVQNACRVYGIDYPRRNLGKTIQFSGVCEHCGNTFTRKYSLKGKTPRFCSQKCNTDHCSKKPDIRRAKCPNCGTIFSWRKHGTVAKDPVFCKRACLLEFHKKSVDRAKGKK